MPFQVLDGDQAVPGSSLRLNGVVHAQDYGSGDYRDATITLQNTSGAVLANGTLDAYSVDEAFNPAGANGMLVKLSGTLDIPSDVPTSEAGELAYLVWTVEFDDGNNAHSIEPISIYGGNWHTVWIGKHFGIGGISRQGSCSST